FLRIVLPALLRNGFIEIHAHPANVHVHAAGGTLVPPRKRQRQRRQRFAAAIAAGRIGHVVSTLVETVSIPPTTAGARNPGWLPTGASATGTARPGSYASGSIVEDSARVR